MENRRFQHKEVSDFVWQLDALYRPLRPLMWQIKKVSTVSAWFWNLVLVEAMESFKWKGIEDWCFLGQHWMIIQLALIFHSSQEVS